MNTQRLSRIEGLPNPKALRHLCPCTSCKVPEQWSGFWETDQRL